MDTGLLIVKLVSLAIFLLLSAFFSASETALFSLDSLKIKRLAQKGKDTSALVRLLENPMRCLTTILAGNTLVNIAAAAVMTSLLISFFGHKGLSISIGVTTLIILTFGEVLPKSIAIHNNERLAYWVTGPLLVFSRILSPLVFLGERVSRRVIAGLRIDLRREPTLTEEEFRTVVEVGHRHGVLGKSEKEMVVSVLELTTTTAQEIMTPRTDIRAINAAWESDKVLAFAREIKRSKIPVFQGSYDNIQGIVYAKDLFLEESRPLAELVRPVLFVPPTKRISELIKDFTRQKALMAVVVDEYGGTSGVVTFQDILDEIFGELYDEFRVQERLIEPTGPNTFRLSGKASLYTVNEECGLRLASEEYETIAGYLLGAFGRIPQEGEHHTAPEGIFTVEKVVGKRIKSVLFEKRP